MLLSKQSVYCIGFLASYKMPGTLDEAVACEKLWVQAPPHVLGMVPFAGNRSWNFFVVALVVDLYISQILTTRLPPYIQISFKRRRHNTEHSTYSHHSNIASSLRSKPAC